MKILKWSAYALLGLSLMVSVTSCKEDEPGTTPPPAVETKGDFTIKLEHRFNATPFALGTEYTTASSEKLTFSTLKYYISNVTLKTADGVEWKQEESYYLVDIENAVNSIVYLNIPDVPTAEYVSMSYMIGVDSLRNVSGAQSGALDPVNDMFWSWNSGYIFSKFEGTSPESSDGTFTYHVGGFKSPNAANVVNMQLTTPEMIKINPDATPEVHFMMNLNAAFDGTPALKVAEMNRVTMPGMMAKEIAMNFQDAFMLHHIHN